VAERAAHADPLQVRLAQRGEHGDRGDHGVRSRPHCRADQVGPAGRVHRQHIGMQPATARAAPATVAGMSCSFRSRKILTPLAPRIDATIPGPYRRYNSSPTLTVLTWGVTSPAQRAAVSKSGASSATAIGAGWVKAPPPAR